MSVIRERLSWRAKDGTKLDAAADAFIAAMESGSFQHLKEYIEREDGKVPDRVANADGSNIELVDRPTWENV